MFHVKQELELLEQCPICGCVKTTEKHKIKDHSKSKKMFTIVTCSDCGFLFTNPRPNQESIGKYYESEEGAR